MFMRIIKLFIFFSIILGIVFASNFPALAGENSFLYSIHIDTPTIVKGYTVNTPDGLLTLGIMPEAMEAESRVEFKNLTTYLNNLEKEIPTPLWMANIPEGWEMASDVYEFNIINKDSFHDKQPIILELRYDNNIERLVNNFKKLFFWNGVVQEWQELPSNNIIDRQAVRSRIHLPYSRLAVFVNSDIMEVGEASWYKYKGCNCAASPDYPKDTLLKVTNLENDKSIVVKVNDYGPDRSIFPKRAIDLDKVAFGKLASLWDGIIKKVKIDEILP